MLNISARGNLMLPSGATSSCRGQIYIQHVSRPNRLLFVFLFCHTSSNNGAETLTRRISNLVFIILFSHILPQFHFKVTNFLDYTDNIDTVNKHTQLNFFIQTNSTKTSIIAYCVNIAFSKSSVSSELADLSRQGNNCLVGKGPPN